MTRRAAVWTALSILAVAGAATQAQIVEAPPADLEAVGIDEKLDNSLPLDLVFNDEEGNAIALGDYFRSDRPVLLSLVYYRCPMLCTLVLDGMLEALKPIDWTPGDEFEVVTVSIDPKDQPALATRKKASYIAAYGRPEAQTGWHFLTGAGETSRALADALGFRYQYVEDRDEYAHAAALFLITPDGRVSRYLYGIKHDPKTLRLSLVEASEGKIGSVVDRFLLYCYQYDATEGKYAPVAQKIMRVGGGIVVLIFGSVLFTFWRREARQKRLA